MSRSSRILCTVLGWTICAAFLSIDGLAQEPPKETSALAHVRRASPGTFTLEVEVDRPAHHFLRGQGLATRTMRITVGGDVTAMVWKVTKLPDPKYLPPDAAGHQEFDYDADGNLIVPIWVEGAALRDAFTNEEYSESIGFRVAPDGTAKEMQSPGVLLIRHRASESNTEGLGLLRRVFWALGRPWADGLGEMMSEDLDADGSCRLRTAGWWVGNSGSGVCELLIEPPNGHLVRRASFGAEGEPPRAESRNEGTRRFGDVTLAERGEFSFLRSETITVRLVSFSRTIDTDLIAEARKVISRARTSLVRVMDKRDDPDHPKLRLVPAGDLDKDE